jgi:hypothetical protein
MKAVVRLTGVLLLSLGISCTQPSQPTESNRQGSEAKAQPSPAASVGGDGAVKSSGERGTPDEAKAMLQRAVEHYNSVGRKQALADFTGKKPPFVDRDLYVVCIGPDRIIIANGGFPSYVGVSSDILVDADSKPVGKAIWEAASSKNEGSIQYRMVNPVSGKFEPKITFWQKLGDDVCGVGAYNTQ